MIKGFDIISGGVQPEIATAVAQILDAELLDTKLKKFANGERYVRLESTVRNQDLFIFQSCADHGGYSLNDALMEVLVIVDAAKRASAREISVVLPLLPYARQDRKSRTREPITSALVLSCLRRAGVNRIITLDLHSTQIQAAFPGPFENISARSLIINEVKNLIQSSPAADFIVVAPDAGSVKNSSKLASELEIPLIFIPKSRDEIDPSKISRPKLTEDLSRKHCIIFDDMVDTGGTIVSAAKALKSSGAESVTVCATHGILSGDASARIKNSDIDLLIVTDSTPQSEHQKVLQGKLKVISIAPLMAAAIQSIYGGDSTVDID